MFNATDIIVLLFLMFFVAQGWEKGFLRCIIGPISLVLCLAISHVVFSSTNNMMLALAIAFLGPTVMTFILGQLFASANRIHGQQIGPNSRILGAIFSSFWGCGVLLIVLMLVSMMPFQLPYLDKAQHNISQSMTLSLLKPVMKKMEIPLPITSDESSGLMMPVDLNDPEVAEKIYHSDEFKAMMADEKIRNIVNDPDVQDAIKEGNYSALFNNKDILAIAQDPVLMKKMMTLYASIMKEETATASPSSLE